MYIETKTADYLGQLLIQSEEITPRQLAEALLLQRVRGSKLAAALIELGHMDPARFFQWLAKRPGTPTIHVNCYDVPSEVTALVPEDFVLEHEVLPLDRMGSLLTVAMVCPLDRATIQELEALTGLRVKPVLCSPEDLRAGIARHYGQGSSETVEVWPGFEISWSAA